MFQAGVAHSCGQLKQVPQAPVSVCLLASIAPPFPSSLWIAKGNEGVERKTKCGGKGSAELEYWAVGEADTGMTLGKGRQHLVIKSSWAGPGSEGKMPR